MEVLESSPPHLFGTIPGGFPYLDPFGISNSFTAIEKPTPRRASFDSSSIEKTRTPPDLSSSSSDSGSDRKDINEKPTLRRTSSELLLSNRKGGKKVDTDLVEGSALSLETKNFNPLLFEGFGGQETKDFNLKLLESSPADGEGSKKLSTNLFEVSPSDGQAVTKDFNPKLLELSSSDVEAEKPLWERLCIDQENLKELDKLMAKRHRPRNGIIWPLPVDSSRDSMWDDDDTSVNEGSRMLDVKIVNLKLVEKLLLADPMWADDDDSSVDEEHLFKYLERLDAKDQTQKEVEREVDDGLSEVKADDFYSLDRLQSKDWITLQLILDRYHPPLRRSRVEPPPPPGAAKERWIFGGNSNSEDSDEDDSDEEDSDYEDSDYEDSDRGFKPRGLHFGLE